MEIFFKKYFFLKGVEQKWKQKIKNWVTGDTVSVCRQCLIYPGKSNVFISTVQIALTMFSASVNLMFYMYPMYIICTCFVGTTRYAAVASSWHYACLASLFRKHPPLGVCFSNKYKPTNLEHILQLTSLVGPSFSGSLYYTFPRHPSTRQSHWNYSN